MTRIAMTAVAALLCTSTAVAHAQDGAVVGAVDASVVGDTRDALPGLSRVGVATPPRAGWAFGWANGYGYTESVLGDDDAHHRVAGILAGSMRVLPALTVALRLDGRYDKHTGSMADDGWIGDTRITFRGGKPVGRMSVGGQLVVWFPGDTPLVPTLDGASAELAGLLDYAVSPSLRLAGTAGARLDRSAGSIPNADRLSAADRMSLGVSDASAILVGGGAVLRRGDTELYGEATWDVLVGSDAPAATESPIRLGAGARVRISDSWSAHGGLEVSLSSRPAVGTDEPLVPIDPRVAIAVGVTWRLGKRPPATQGDIHIVDDDTPPPDPTPDEISGVVRGRVIAPDGAPMAGVNVRAGDAVTETDATGRFELRGLPAGTVTVTIAAVPPYAERTATIEVGAETAVLGDIAVERDLPAGQIRGVVHDVAGTGVAATIRIEPLGKQVKAGADGTFRIDVPPGRYQVVIDGPGLVAQRRKIQVEQNGVTVLNVELRPEQRR